MLACLLGAAFVVAALVGGLGWWRALVCKDEREWAVSQRDAALYRERVALGREATAMAEVKRLRADRDELARRLDRVTAAAAGD